jgi:hypothetical protein
MRFDCEARRRRSQLTEEDMVLGALFALTLAPINFSWKDCGTAGTI